MDYTTLPLSVIQPDNNQPRKYFDAAKMGFLERSITKLEGIKTPLIVRKDGKYYTIVNGERRFRVAQKLGMKEVPVVITEVSDPLELLIMQFQLQETNENWTTTEKASAILELATAMKMPLPELCKELGIDRGSISRYVAFAQLQDKDLYIRSEIGIEHAVHIERLKRGAKKLYERKYEEEFTRTEEKKLERALIHRITDDVMGGNSKSTSYLKLKDAFTKDPSTINKFIEDRSITPDALFIKTKAQGAYFLRNVGTNASYLRQNIDLFLEKQDVLPSKEVRDQVAKAIVACEKFMKATQSED